jgi:16S rRNA (adenine(1408)-N(1))-methyltransferase
MAATPSLTRHAPATPAVLDLAAWSSAYTDLHIDLGTGDGAFALAHARAHPETAVIGIDACLDHLRAAARRRPANLRFVAANALALPAATIPRAGRVTINFPYGSLLRGLVEADLGLLAGLGALLAPVGQVEVRVNATAFVATGLDPNTGPEAIARSLQRLDGVRGASRALDQDELRAVPSTWAKRLGYGRPTQAWLVTGIRADWIIT